MRIQGGNGTGAEAFVDSEGRLSIFATVETEDKHVNKHRGKVWSLPFTTTPVAAGDYFFYMKNTGTEDYLITDIRIDAASAEVVSINKVSGTASFTAGGAISPVNRNLGSALTPAITVQYDTDTTGLTDGGELYFLTCEANSLAHLRASSTIIVTPGSSVALKATTGGISLQGMVSISGLD